MEKNRYDPEIIRLGLTIKKLRIKEKLTQENLATLCDVDVRSIQRIEAGKQNISFTLLLSIAESLNIKADTLLSKILNQNEIL